MNIIQFFKNLFNKETVINYGIVKKDADNSAPSSSVVSQTEVVAQIATANFKGVKGDGTIRNFPYQYQNGCSGCVCFTASKIGTILYSLLKNTIINFSPGFIYTQRRNKPEQGTCFDDMVKISNTKGCLLGELMPSEGIDETDMNALTIAPYQAQEALAFTLPPTWVDIGLDFNSVASTVEATKKGIMLWFNFSLGEFFGTQYPSILNGNNTWQHSVTAVDTTIINGVKYIVIEDSADEEPLYQKYISQSFFNAKCFLARYPLNFNWSIPVTPKPKFDGSVTSLQDCLKYDGELASNIPSTGFFGDLTKQALIKYQTKYNIIPSVGYFGLLTKADLLKRFN